MNLLFGRKFYFTTWIKKKKNKKSIQNTTEVLRGGINSAL